MRIRLALLPAVAAGLLIAAAASAQTPSPSPSPDPAPAPLCPPTHVVCGSSCCSR